MITRTFGAAGKPEAGVTGGDHHPERKDNTMIKSPAAVPPRRRLRLLAAAIDPAVQERLDAVGRPELLRRVAGGERVTVGG